MISSLKDLSNPKKFNDPLDIDHQDEDTLKKILTSMVIIRRVEQKLALEKKNGTIGGPVHLSVGQEAIAVGVSQNLKKTDYVFGAHRSHGHLLALNPDYYKLFAEVLGKETGFSKGMGGSMHLFDPLNGFHGSVPIVAGTVPLAVGTAMASKMKKKDDISVVYLGDGAAEEGIVHESFNLAKVRNAPVLFVVENNLFASHMNISLRQTSDMISRFASANHIPYKVLDGNDVIKVAQTSKELIADIRAGKGPGFLELITYRWFGHVDWREDVDVGIKRSLKDIKNWKKRDPILRLTQSMMKAKIWDKDKELELNKKISEKLDFAWAKALKDKSPPLNSTIKYVYQGI